jgi:peptide/nickel transport system permease protein
VSGIEAREPSAEFDEMAVEEAIAPVGHARPGIWHRLVRNPLAVIGLVWIAFLLLCFLVPGLLATHDPVQQDVTLTRLRETPSADHWLGTDAFGRDLYSRIIWGGRLTVKAILIALGLSTLIGIPVGLLSGWHGGRVDRAIMWIVDVLFSLPLILLALAIVGALGTGLVPAMIAVGVLLSTRFARLTRGVALAEREELYVDAARISGLSTPTILRRYILPNLWPVLIVQIAIISGVILLVGAVLSFIGVGSPPDSYDWGAMLNQGREQVLAFPYQVVPSAAAIVLTVLAFNLVGDGVRDAIGQPTVRPSRRSERRDEPTRGVAESTAHPDGALLSISNLSVEFPGAREQVAHVLDGVTLAVRPGETLCIVGESGSGKSMTVLTALGLTPPPGRRTAGEVRFDGLELIGLTERQWQSVRGRRIGMIFQEPVAVLNPGLTVGAHLVETLRLDRRAARSRAIELLTLVRVPDPERRIDEYPHQFSGGMAQRVGIALALACDPVLLIADEPTTALDVTVQGQILDLLAEIQERLGMAMILITHDLGVVAEVADRVAVMYAGQVVESGDATEVFRTPQHPYTSALLATMPQHHERDDELSVIPGTVPSPTAWPGGCRFHPRCPVAVDACHVTPPTPGPDPDRVVRCLLVHPRHASCQAPGVTWGEGAS